MQTRVEITFLGTGTSIGVPVIGCDCAVCTSDDPKKPTAPLLPPRPHPEVSLIVDTGPDFRQQCLREGIRDLDAVLFTHAHSDHIMGSTTSAALHRARGRGDRDPRDGECLERLHAAFTYVFDGENRYRGYLKAASHVIRDPSPSATYR